MNFRFVFALLSMFGLMASSCSDPAPVVISDISVRRMLSTDREKPVTFTGSGFLPSSTSNSVNQCRVGKTSTGVRTVSDTELTVLVTPDRSVCGPVSIQFLVSGGVVASTDLFSFYSETATFESPKKIPGTVSSIQGMAVANFNSNSVNEAGTADRFSDLAVARKIEKDIQIFLGIDSGTGVSNGSFAPPVSIPLGLEPSALVSADFDLNGTADLAVALTNGTDYQVSFLSGKGDGTFESPVVIVSAQAKPLVALFAGYLQKPSDPNGKPTLSLGVVSAMAQAVEIRMYQNANFVPTGTASVTLPMGSTFQSMSTGDFDGDGNLDMAIAASGSKDIIVKYGQGDSLPLQFVDRTFSLTYAPLSLVSEDYNSDGLLDLVVLVSEPTTPTLRVLLGRGSALFEVQSINAKEMAFSAGAAPKLLSVGDFNGDRKMDLVISGQTAGVSLAMNKCPL